MGKYYIHYTDNNRPPIEVDEFNVDESTLDVALFGRVRQEYGERLNQNLLNLAVAKRYITEEEEQTLREWNVSPSTWTTEV